MSGMMARKDPGALPWWTILAFMVAGVCLILMLANAGEQNAAQQLFVHLSSDCLTMGVRAGLIDSYGAVPGPQDVDGSQRYTMTVQMGNLAYRFCYADQQKRDAALGQVQRAVGAP